MNRRKAAGTITLLSSTPVIKPPHTSKDGGNNSIKRRTILGALFLREPGLALSIPK
jgi:hypothetical protein